MASDIEKMYLDLSELLRDICSFFSSEHLDNFSSIDRRKAQLLIDRSKKQLEKISVVQSSLGANEDVKQKRTSHSAPKDKHSNSNIGTDEDDPYKDLPTKDASDSPKAGWVYMRRKFLLGFEKMKHVYATIHRDWLLVYLSEREHKPMVTFNLKYHEALPSDDDKGDFKLVSKDENDKKTYYFEAYNRKDMLQWTTQLNYCHEGGLSKKTDIDASNIEEVGDYHDDNGSIYQGISDDDSDNIYQEFTTVKKKVYSLKQNLPSSNNAMNKPAPPPRPVAYTRPCPTAVTCLIKSKPSSVSNSISSLPSYDEITADPAAYKSNSTSSKSVDTFSEGSEDSTYEEFTSVRTRVVHRS